nr:uncharacterized protein akna isoform X1 [Nerophis lumbriciformis]XP_061836730.1 uncharacterized protein akna isoform X1 [Nerophis lumbriciformis]
METIKNTKVGVLSWTPAPARISPASSLMSEDDTDEQDCNFFSQMDDNGIIRLTDALVDEMHEDNGITECHPAFSPVPPSPEDLDGYEIDVLPEEQISILNDHLENVDLLANDDDEVCILRQQSDHEDEEKDKMTTKEVQSTEEDTCIGKAQEERNGSGEGERVFRKETVSNDKETSENQCFESPFLFLEANGDCKPQCITYKALSCPTLLLSSHLCPFTAEESTVAAGIDIETIPDKEFPDSPLETNSAMSCVSSPRHHQQKSKKEEEEFEDTTISEYQHSTVNEHSNKGLKKLTFSPRQRSPSKDRFQSPRRDNESRKGYPSHAIPDLSKVKSRVSFPKGDYKPPKSRWSTNNSPKCLTPVVFKSPADIVKEVLLNTTDGSQTLSDYNKRTSTGSPSSTVPQEFRCQHKAHILAEQLQEDYNRLLTKYAEAGNTIDRLRLEAKVKLHSDQPRPAHFDPSGLYFEPSKIMRLEFPQAQRAQPSPGSPPSNEPSSQRSTCGLSSLSASISNISDFQGGPQVASTLYAQADGLLQQLQRFEEQLKCKIPKGTGLSTLYEGLDSLEKGYLLAKKEKEGTASGHFDPNRELEEFIYQCGLHLDALKEKVEQRADVGHPPLTATKSSSDDLHSENQHMIDPTEITESSSDETKGTEWNLNSAHLNQKCEKQAVNVNQTSTTPVSHPANDRRRKKIENSCSSSLSSLGDITASEKKWSKPHNEIRRAFYQDRIVSPGTDSGFVGSETSHQTPGLASSSLRQKTSSRRASVSGHQEVCSVKPHKNHTSSPPLGSSHSCSSTTTKQREYFQQESGRSCQDESRQGQWVSQADTTRIDSETAQTASEDTQSVQYDDSPSCSSPSPSSASALNRCSGDALKTLKSRQAVIHNDPSRSRQTISARPKERRERTKESKADHLSQRNCTKQRTSTPLFISLRSVEPSVDRDDSSQKTWTIVEDEVQKVGRRAARRKLPYKQQIQPDSSTASDLENSACHLLVTRSTQTSIAVADSKTSNTSVPHVHHIKQDLAKPEKGDNETGGAPPCPQCLSRHSGSSETGGNLKATHFCCCHCHHGPYCGYHDARRRSEPDCCKDSNVAPTSSHKPECPGRVAAAAVCPTSLLLYLHPQAIHMYANNSSSPSKEDKQRSSRPPQRVVPRRSVDETLQEACIMQDKSKHMLRELEEGMRHLEQQFKTHY